jgi:hypothetical protein
VHTFGSTGEAYDASQCDDNIKNGDVLIIPSERVAGVLVEAWPVAVTAECGHFHRFNDDADVSRFPSVRGDKVYDYSEAVAFAKAYVFDAKDMR